MNYLVFIILFCSIRVFGQDYLDNLEKKTEESFEKRGINYHDIKCDTLLVDGKMYFFKKSPISYFKGYTRIFNSEEVIILASHLIPGSKGYTVTWVIKNNRLYIDRISWKNYANDMASNEKGEMLYKKPSENVIKKRFEQLTAEKFNKEGLLPASWVNGEIGLLTLNPDYNSGSGGDTFRQYLENNQEHYKIVFNKGEFVRLQLVKGKKKI